MAKHSVGDIVLMSEVCHAQDLPEKYKPGRFGIIVAVEQHVNHPLYAVLDTSRDIRLPWYSNYMAVRTEVKNVPREIQEELEARLIQYKRLGFDPWFYNTAYRR
ncbi:MAG TPA: hypothetical protein DCP92_03455 [Nitrospiraceae bacterium]|jgi:hypothetical protein|nr:hypothetical protein [Nitrospiraceae bacterium]